MEPGAPGLTVCTACSGETHAHQTDGYKPLPNLKHDSEHIVAVLIQNGIPSYWIAHRYPYGAQYIRDCLLANTMDTGLFQEVDVQCLHRIEQYGIPPEIPE